MVEDVNRGASRAKPEDGKNVGKEEVAQRREGREGFCGKVWGDIVGEFRGLLMGSGFHFTETKAVSPARESVDRVLRMTEKAPPPLRAPAARLDVLAPVAFGVSLISALIIAEEIYILNKHARYVANLAAGTPDGDAAFSANFHPQLHLFLAAGSGGFASVLLIFSIWHSRIHGRPMWSVFHIGGLILLLPSLCQLLQFLIRMFS